MPGLSRYPRKSTPTARVFVEYPGDSAVTQRLRSFLVASVLPAFLLASLSTAVAAAQAKPTRWSDRATWPDRKVPVAGAKVTIPEGKSVILDVSPPPLGSTVTYTYRGLTPGGAPRFASFLRVRPDA